MKPLEPTILDNFLRISHETPDRLFATFLSPSGESESVTYGDLLIRAQKLAAGLLTQRVESGQVVLIILEPGLSLIAVYLGVMLCGGIPCIHPFPSPKLTEEAYRHALGAVAKACAPCLIVTSSNLAARIGQMPLEENTFCFTVDQLNHTSIPFISKKNTRPDDVAILQHSSGTTGLKKGIALSHRTVMNQLNHYASALNLNDNDRIVTWLPFYHDMGLIATFLLPLVTGIPLFLMSPFDWVASPALLLQAISAYRGTLCWQPNFAYNFLAANAREQDLTGINLSTMRAFINCAEPVQEESHETFYRRFETYGLRRETLCTCYAMAENTFAVTQGGITERVGTEVVDVARLGTENIAYQPSAGAKGRKLLSSGRVIEGNEIQVMNTKQEILPERSVGELVIRSDSMLSEYFRSPQLTQDAIRNGWYHTGDLGYMSDQNLFVLGRQKDLIIVMGKNIHPQDVEAIASAIPGIHPGRVASFGVYNESAGTEDLIVLAEKDPQLNLSPAEIKLALARTIYEQLDCTVSEVRFVPPMWLAKSSSGKIARSANRDKYLKEIRHVV